MLRSMQLSQTAREVTSGSGELNSPNSLIQYLQSSSKGSTESRDDAFHNAPGSRDHTPIDKESTLEFSASKSSQDITCLACKGPWLLENAVPDPREVLTLFNATISCKDQVHRARTQGEPGARQNGPVLWFPVRGKYDTGADADFVSQDVLERAELEPFVRKLRTPVRVKALGAEVDFDQVIKLTWVLHHETVSEEREFFVAKDADFDILLGEPYLKEHNYMKIYQNQSMVTKLSFRQYVANAFRTKGKSSFPGVAIS